MTTAPDPVARKMQARIHIRAKETGLDNDTYRGLLTRVTGKQSTREMSRDDMKAVLAAIDGRTGSTFRPAKKKQARMVYGLWQDLRRAGKVRAATPRGFCRRMTGKDDPDWCGPEELNILIEALKNWDQRHG